jgi:hypothetical protein
MSSADACSATTMNRSFSGTASTVVIAVYTTSATARR